MISEEEWTIKIAEEISPQEIDFASVWTEAFVKGAKDRQELFKQTNAQAAGFLPGDFIPIIPIILKTLTITIVPLVTILKSEDVGKFLEGVKNALAVGEIFGKAMVGFLSFLNKKLKTPRWTEAIYKRPNETVAKLDKEKEEVRISEAIYTQLNEVIARLDKEMQVLALEQSKSDSIKLSVLRLFLENPMDATHFLNKLTEKK